MYPKSFRNLDKSSLEIYLYKKTNDRYIAKKYENFLFSIQQEKMKELFGTLKGKWKKSAQELKDELREEDARRFAKLDKITKKSKLA